MNQIVEMIEALQEDNESLIITDELIKQYIEDNVELLINEIQDELIGNDIERRKVNGNSK